MSSSASSGDLTVVTDDVLLDRLRANETLRNQLAAADHALINEVERRGLAHEYGCRDTKVLLRELLRLRPGDASARVHAAAMAGSRVSVQGEPLEPIFALVAAGQASGVLSPGHAQVIVQCVNALPDAAAEHTGPVEASLVQHAADLDPTRLETVAARIAAHLDPDGRLKDVSHRERHRGVIIRQRADGSASIVGELTAACTERVLTVMDTLARPRPAADGERDPRSAQQRHHDALLDACDRLIGSGSLPDVGGVTTTVLITMTEEAWKTGRGVATTGHGAILPATTAIELAGGDYRLLAVAINSLGAITGHGRAHRLFTETQRLAMTARDHGCSFPGCTVPPAWTQAHHVRAWVNHGKTTVANGTLLCGHHHRSFEKSDWRCEMRDGRPAWIPPPHVDREQHPRTNRVHHAEIEFARQPS